MFNDLLDELEKKGYEIFAYADDLAIVGQSNSMLGHAIEIAEQWATDNQMTINKKKSGIIIHKKNSKRSKKRKEVKGYPIVNEYKYLGVYIDSKMSFRPHLEYIRKKIDNGFKLINIMKWK